jgi:hypothetical protein
VTVEVVCVAAPMAVLKTARASQGLAVLLDDGDGTPLSQLSDVSGHHIVPQRKVTWWQLAAFAYVIVAGEATARTLFAAWLSHAVPARYSLCRTCCRGFCRVGVAH